MVKLAVRVQDAVLFLLYSANKNTLKMMLKTEFFMQILTQFVGVARSGDAWAVGDGHVCEKHDGLLIVAGKEILLKHTALCIVNNKQ